MNLPEPTCPNIDAIIKSIRNAIYDMKQAELDTYELNWIESAMEDLRQDNGDLRTAAIEMEKERDAIAAEMDEMYTQEDYDEACSQAYDDGYRDAMNSKKECLTTNE